MVGAKMGFVMKYGVCLVLTWISLSETIFIAAPKAIQPNRDYSVAISIRNNEISNGTLLLHLEGEDLDGRQALNLTKTVNVQSAIKQMITFQIPNSLPDGKYRIIMDGKRDFNVSYEYWLNYRPSSLLGFIQLNKQVFTPGDKVKFRVIVLNDYLKPAQSNESTVSVYVNDPNDDVIRQWSNVTLNSGVFENQIVIPSIAVRGAYSIIVKANGKQIEYKLFIVWELDLFSVDLNVYPSVVPFQEHQALNLTIDLKNYFGKPLSGSVSIAVLADSLLHAYRKWNVTGMQQVYLPFDEKLEIDGPSNYVDLYCSFSPHNANYNHTIKVEQIKVYKYKYKVKLEQILFGYHPGSPFIATLNVAYHNDEPAKNATLLVRVEGGNETYERNYTSNLKGDITFSFDTSTSSKLHTLKVFEDDHELLQELIYWLTNTVILKCDLKLLSLVKFNRMVRVMVTCSHDMNLLHYYIVSKGNIVEFGFLRPNMTRHILEIVVSNKLIPRAKVVVLIRASGAVQVIALDISINELGNPLEIKIEENISEDGVDPGDEIELSIRGRPGSFVILAAYDQRLLQESKNHDIHLDEIWQKFEACFETYDEKNDAMEKSGLLSRFLKTGVNAHTPTAASEYKSRGILPDAPREQMPGPYRTDFWESWLWQNVTIPASGRVQLVTTVPHTATSWFITGISIHPEYGLGIVKKPIQFATVKILFILDHLPHAIRRGETVSLHFTLYNTVSEEFEATVTIFSVMNQIHFVGRPKGEANETKHVFIPPKSEIPISFLAKAMKLGELEVRVNASVSGVISDSFKKIINVLPELVAIKETTRYFVDCNAIELRSSDHPYEAAYIVNATYYPLTPDQKVSLTLSNITLEDLDSTHFHYYNESDLVVDYNSTSEKIRINMTANEKLANSSSGCYNGVIQLVIQYRINLDNLNPRFDLNVSKQSTPAVSLRQFEVCCSFIPEQGVDHSNGTLVEVSIPTGYAMDSHSVEEITNINPINRTEVLHGGSTIRVFYNNIGTERNCFVVFAYRRYTMPVRRPVYIFVKDYYHPELRAYKAYDLY